METVLIDHRHLLARDVETILACPSCGASPLTSEPAALSCSHCKASYPVDPRHQICALVGQSTAGAIKGNIQSWWGDLYQQLYATADRTLDAAGLDRMLVELEDLFLRRKHLALVEMPLAHLAGRRVLEIGSGGGAHSSLFKKHGASVVSVDLTPERAVSSALKLSLTRGGEGRAYQADAEHLPFRSESFDIVYSNGVLHHSESTEQCVAEVRRVLKPGGRGVIMLYCRSSMTYWLNIVPRALFSGLMFRHPEAQWAGLVTEGKPKFGTVRNPITRVYARAEIQALFAGFRLVSLRKSSFQFDNLAVPRLTQIRSTLLRWFGAKTHLGGVLVYGEPIVPETAVELALGKYLGFAWNIVVEKP